MQQFQVKKDDLNTTRLVNDLPKPEIGNGEVLLKLDQFAFTANNITYAAAGDLLGYWQFFIPLGDDTDGWGVIPVWGFADVVESKVADVPVGERLYGYFPPATYVAMQPIKISEQRLFEGAAHRAKLPAGYNSYSRVNNEPGYSNEMDQQRMLLWPLHITSFCLWDKLKAADWFGAEQLVIVSASSKTSIGLGYALDADAEAPAGIGLTSGRNIKMVGSLDIYTETFDYDAIASLATDKSTVVVDMSGNADVLAALQQHLGEQLKRIINVGFTHWDSPKAADEVVAAKSEMFFAPSHIQQRMKDWGPQGFADKTSGFMRETAMKSRQWLQVEPKAGLSGLADVYPAVCEGSLSPKQGVVVKL